MSFAAKVKKEKKSIYKIKDKQPPHTVLELTPRSRTYELRGQGEKKKHFKNTKNLFIHIARIPIGDSPRDIPTF